MAMQPIDLQTLFTQMDKVARSQSQQREGLQIQQSLQHIESQRKVEEQIRSVNEAQNTGDGAEKINDGRPRQQEQEAERQETPEEEEEADPKKSYLIRDPSLGRIIDISG